MLGQALLIVVIAAATMSWVMRSRKIDYRGKVRSSCPVPSSRKPERDADGERASAAVLCHWWLLWPGLGAQRGAGAERRRRGHRRKGPGQAGRCKGVTQGDRILPRDGSRRSRITTPQAKGVSDTQVIEALSADLTIQRTSADAFAHATTAFGGKPDFVFLCAGFAKPGFLVETSEADMRAVRRDGARASNRTQLTEALLRTGLGRRVLGLGVDGASEQCPRVWRQHPVADMHNQIAAQAYAKDQQTGRRIVFVSSFLALASFVGYSAYAPGKYALRGELLALTLFAVLTPYGGPL